MCTIITLCGVRADYPVVLATNRDEFFSRKSQGATLLLGRPKAVGGRDLVAMGSWMGVTEDGLFVSVTNQRTMEPPRFDKRSRGEVVLRALELGTREAVRHYVGTLDGRDYNAFNLLWGDASGLEVAYARGEAALELADVPTGVHVLPNDRLDSPAFYKVERARTLVQAMAHAPFELLVAALKHLLADTTTAPPDRAASAEPTPWLDQALLQKLSALCVETEAYGTRSSTIVALEPNRVAHYLYADGPPGRAPFEDVTPLFTADQPPG